MLQIKNPYTHTHIWLQHQQPKKRKVPICLLFFVWNRRNNRSNYLCLKCTQRKKSAQFNFTWSWREFFVRCLIYVYFGRNILTNVQSSSALTIGQVAFHFFVHIIWFGLFYWRLLLLLGASVYWIPYRSVGINYYYRALAVQYISIGPNVLFIIYHHGLVGPHVLQTAHNRRIRASLSLISTSMLLQSVAIWARAWANERTADANVENVNVFRLGMIKSKPFHFLGGTWTVAVCKSPRAISW